MIHEDLIDGNPAWCFAGYYEDIGQGLDFSKHHEWATLVKRCRAGEIDIVLSESPSCFGKSPVLFYENMKTLSECGVDAVTEAMGSLSADFIASRLSACLIFNPDTAHYTKSSIAGINSSKRKDVG